ncbi:hypothetical protein Pint_05897 [Pistacia integerrima]|uniref:Uncharacterized protein n=1 Tax=Pistacia integerrima TaxID=434235 RepID=A0ACC0Z2B9_9ROSI|nr:hypothetical protein Pint_05897 [Pistacia integerrima]
MELDDGNDKIIISRILAASFIGAILATTANHFRHQYEEEAQEDQYIIPNLFQFLFFLIFFLFVVYPRVYPNNG